MSKFIPPVRGQQSVVPDGMGWQANTYTGHHWKCTKCKDMNYVAAVLQEHLDTLGLEKSPLPVPVKHHPKYEKITKVTYL